jgi:hypothetical protein
MAYYFGLASAGFSTVLAGINRVQNSSGIPIINILLGFLVVRLLFLIVSIRFGSLSGDNKER